MNINGTEYYFTIEPTPYGNVRAEISKRVEAGSKYMDVLHIQVCSRTFGRWYRRPKKKDYINAKAWVQKELRNIKDYNDTEL